jgi:hypothetical protein
VDLPFTDLNLQEEKRALEKKDLVTDKGRFFQITTLANSLKADDHRCNPCCGNSKFNYSHHWLRITNIGFEDLSAAIVR